eukprot:TRINITY_DN8344_c0_g2_i3.p1 TRINITY_DN8344_c0_g2~~TRINITY_DN8344_c0_g2_i3.p1  ORF type:complete len:121 (-),score=15.98 TRINITY_DN8344_c0_g2_i3:254-616(-)
MTNEVHITSLTMQQCHLPCLQVQAREGLIEGDSRWSSNLAPQGLPTAGQCYTRHAMATELTPAAVAEEIVDLNSKPLGSCAHDGEQWRVPLRLALRFGTRQSHWEEWWAGWSSGSCTQLP